MSREAVESFFREIHKNADLKSRFLKEIGDAQLEVASVVKDKTVDFAKAEGFDFSSSDLEKYSAELADKIYENNEVSESEMEKVAGGLSKTSATLASVWSAGIVCAVLSLYAATQGKGKCEILMSTKKDYTCKDG